MWTPRGGRASLTPPPLDPPMVTSVASQVCHWQSFRLSLSDGLPDLCVYKHKITCFVVLFKTMWSNHGFRSQDNVHKQSPRGLSSHPTDVGESQCTPVYLQTITTWLVITSDRCRWITMHPCLFTNNHHVVCHHIRQMSVNHNAPLFITDPTWRRTTHGDHYVTGLVPGAGEPDSLVNGAS